MPRRADEERGSCDANSCDVYRHPRRNVCRKEKDLDAKVDHWCSYRVESFVRNPSAPGGCRYLTARCQNSSQFRFALDVLATSNSFLAAHYSRVQLMIQSYSTGYYGRSSIHSNKFHFLTSAAAGTINVEATDEARIRIEFRIQPFSEL